MQRNEPLEKQQYAVFDGFHAWKHAARFGFPLLTAVTSDVHRIQLLVEQLASDLSHVASELYEVDEGTFADLSRDLGIRMPHHTGVLAWGFRPPADESMVSTSKRVSCSSVPSVLVDGARHPGNFGAVVRVAAAADCPAVFGLGNLDPWHVDVVRGSAGLHAAVSVLRLGSAAELEGPIFALDADGDDIGSFQFPPGSVLAVGAERDGVSDEVRARCAGLVSLPMRKGVSSMNLATSVSAALYAHLAMKGFSK